jgi:hypothetical protein
VPDFRAPAVQAHRRHETAPGDWVRLTGLEPATSTSGAWRSLRAELQAREGECTGRKDGPGSRRSLPERMFDARMPLMRKRVYTKPCTFRGCYRNAKAHGLCTGHLDQRTRGLTLRPIKPRRDICDSPDWGESTSPLGCAVPIGIRCAREGWFPSAKAGSGIAGWTPRAMCSFAVTRTTRMPDQSSAGSLSMSWSCPRCLGAPAQGGVRASPQQHQA